MFELIAHVIMKVDIEYPRYEGVCELRTGLPLPESVQPALEKHIGVIEELKALGKLPIVFNGHVSYGVSIPIKQVYTETIYRNYFRDFGIYERAGVYLFMQRELTLYIGSSYDLADRLRKHVLNYQRRGVESRSPFVGYADMIYGFATNRYLDLETELIRVLHPIWNQKVI